MTLALPLPTATSDQRERALQDVRISVTDRCNFRCTYCMPRERFGPDHAFLPRPGLLTVDEITPTTGASGRRSTRSACG